MFDYVYKVNSLTHSEGNTLNAVLDLGFDLPKPERFRLLGVSDADAGLIYEVLTEELPYSDLTLLKSVKRAGKFYADVTYFVHDQWHNLAKQVLLRREADRQDASKQNELSSHL